jgi:AraC-like DNA-binding protein
LNYQVIAPCEELKEIVSYFWVGTLNQESLISNQKYYIIANYLTEISFAFSGTEKNDELLFSVVQGHTETPIQLPVDKYYHVIGVSLYSFAIPTLFNISALELNEEFISLTTFLGKDADILNEKMASASTIEQRIKVLSDYFISLQKNQKTGDERLKKSIQVIKKFNGNLKIKDLADNFFLSNKQFNRRFKEFSGFNPKMYARIVRIESAIKSFNEFSSLSELALNAGYYDQAHFIRDFKGLTGFSPLEFWKLSEGLG